MSVVIITIIADCYHQDKGNGIIIESVRHSLLNTTNCCAYTLSLISLGYLVALTNNIFMMFLGQRSVLVQRARDRFELQYALPCCLDQSYQMWHCLDVFFCHDHLVFVIKAAF